MASVGGVKAKGADLQNRRGAIGLRPTSYPSGIGTRQQVVGNPPWGGAPLSFAVSFAVSFSRHSVDLRVRCYDTDAQDLA